jgi:hypothetical protein
LILDSGYWIKDILARGKGQSSEFRVQGSEETHIPNDAIRVPRYEIRSYSSEFRVQSSENGSRKPKSREQGAKGEEMEMKVDLEKIYVPSEEVVAREIEGEIIIVPLTSGIGDMEDELFTLNETGKVFWKGMDGKKTLGEITRSLTASYTAPLEEIEADALGFMTELIKRKIVVEK